MIKTNLQGQYAGFSSRAAALIADVLIIGLIVMVVNLFVPAVIRQLTRFDLQTCATTAERTFVVYSCTAINWTLAAFSILFAPLYTIICWILVGQTPGKYLFGLRVVRLSGKGMNLTTSIIRYLCYGLCVLSLGLGFLNVLIDDQRQGWNDVIARTCVIYTWEARQNTALLDRVQNRLQRKQSQSNQPS